MKTCELGYEIAQKKVNCSKCFGRGFYSGRYGQTACDLCNQRGYFWQDYKRKIKQR